MPEPPATTPPVPLIVPLKLCAVGLANVTSPLSAMLPASEPLLPTPSPNCRVVAVSTVVPPV